MSTVPTTPLAPEELRRRVAEELESWEAGELAAFLERRGESKERFLTGARNEVDRVYGPEHVADTDWEDVGLPGRFPTPAGRTRRCTARARGRCARSRASARRRRPTSASST